MHTRRLLAVKHERIADRVRTDQRTWSSRVNSGSPHMANWTGRGRRGAENKAVRGKPIEKESTTAKAVSPGENHRDVLMQEPFQTSFGDKMEKYQSWEDFLAETMGYLWVR